MNVEHITPAKGVEQPTFWQREIRTLSRNAQSIADTIVKAEKREDFWDKFHLYQLKDAAATLPHLFVTNHPERLYETDKPYFTVTSKQAVDDLLNKDEPIIPYMNLKRNRKPVHSGLGLDVYYSVLKAFGFTNTGSAEFVWTGDKIDMHQAEIVDRISRNQPESVERLKALFLDSSHDKPHLHPLLRMLVEKINIDRSSLGTLDSNLSGYRDELITALYECTGMRGGHWNNVNNLLSGDGKKFDLKFDKILALSRLLSPFENPRESISSEVAIVEIDVKKAMKKYKPWPYPITARPSVGFMPMTFINRDMVTAVYTKSGEGNINGVPLKKMDDIDDKYLLPDAGGVPYRPFINDRIIDPASAICSTRYASQKKETAFHEAELAPWNTLGPIELFVHSNVGQAYILRDTGSVSQSDIDNLKREFLKLDPTDDKIKGVSQLSYSHSLTV